MKQFRVQKQNTAAVLAAFHSLDLKATAGPPRTALFNGCGDPNCCAQYHGAHLMDGIYVDATHKQIRQAMDLFRSQQQ